MLTDTISTRIKDVAGVYQFLDQFPALYSLLENDLKNPAGLALYTTIYTDMFDRYLYIGKTESQLWLYILSGNCEINLISVPEKRNIPQRFKYLRTSSTPELFFKCLTKWNKENLEKYISSFQS